MMDFATIVTIGLMAISTYIVRIVGYLALKNKSIGPRMAYVLECLPGCVLISVIAPAFVSSNPADLIGLAITLIAAMTLPLLPTVIIGIIATGALRALLN